jgi:hypothetical protein
MSVMKSRRLMGAYPKAEITTDYSSFGVGRWRASQQKTPHDRLGSGAVDAGQGARRSVGQGF